MTAMTKVPLGIDVYDLEGSLVSVIATLEKYLADIPEPYRGSAEIDLEIDDYYGGTTIVVTSNYSRPETDEEREERERAAHVTKHSRELLERQQLAALKAKYEK